MKLRKSLLMILGVILLVGIGVGIWYFLDKKATSETAKDEPARNINVQALGSDDEKKIGTIIYGGAKLDGEIKTGSKDQTVNLITTDSLDGAFNIYYQDITNRYKTYSVTKKDITKDDALNQKARVMVCTGVTGKITVTVWGDTSGMTHIEIVTSKDFK